jgi:hypothetical protein
MLHFMKADSKGEGRVGKEELQGALWKTGIQVTSPLALTPWSHIIYLYLSETGLAMQ